MTRFALGRLGRGSLAKGFCRRACLLTSVLAAVTFSAACTSAQIVEFQSAAGPDAPLGEDSPIIMAKPSPGMTFIGSYLSGRHAQSLKDSDKAIEFFRAALDDDPDNPDLNLRAAVLLVSEGQLAEAVPLLRKLPEGGSKSTIANFILSVHDIAEGRFEAAAERLAALPENGINHFVGPLLQAWALAGQGDTDAALGFLGDLTDTAGAEALHDLHAGLINDLGGRDAEALEALRGAVSGDRARAFRAIELVGQFLERTGRGDEALQIYERFLAQHPDSDLVGPELSGIKAGRTPPHDIVTAADGTAQALFDLAGVFRQQNAREMALLFGRLALSLKPDFPAGQILIGDILETNERPEAANRVYQAIDKASPFAWSARIRIVLNLDQMDRPEEAIAELRALAAERPDDAEALITLGGILRGRERYGEAVEVYDEAVDRVGILENRHWSLLYSRGMSLERSKQWSRAEADFLKALEFEPEQPYVLNYLGYSWVDQGLYLERAMKMIGQAVQLRPNDGFIVDSLGWAHYRLDDMEAAVEELERAAELRPEDPVINDHLGDAYWRVGRQREARFQWNRSLDLNPEPDLIATIEEKLEHGLSDAGKPDGDG